MKRIEFIKKLFGSGILMFLPLGFIKSNVERKATCLLEFDVKGFRYYEGPDLIGKMRNGEALSLVREPENKFDKNAIAIHYKNQKIGFVPREKNEVLSKLLDAGSQNVSAEIVALRDDDVSWDAVTAKIYMSSTSNI